MKIKTIFFLPILVSILVSETGFAQNIKPELDELVATLSETTTGGTVLVANNGNVLYRKAFGKAEIELDVAMEPRHVFRIGSITKQFTAAAILKLEEEGRISLKDDIRKYVQDYPSRGYTITIEHLLTHTSGIANYTGIPKFNGKVRREDMTPLQLIDFFKDEPMDFAPGEKFKYNNSGYIILGHIIETVTGKTYAEYLKEKFFMPLGMNDTRYDSPSEIIKDRVPGYGKDNGGYRNADYLSMTLPYAGGSLLSTVDDLLLWNGSVAERKLLSKGSIDSAHSRFTLKDGGSTDYGYGWRLGYVQESPTIKHGGTVNGFTSFALYLPEERIYVAILTNCTCTGNIELFASEMAAVAMGRPYNLTEARVSDKKMKARQGTYCSAGGAERTIRYEDGELLYFMRGGNKTGLVPLDLDTFRLGESLSVIEFDNENGGFMVRGLDSPVKWAKTNGQITALKSISLSQEEKEKYTGEYRLSQDRIFKVVAKDGRLFGVMGTNSEEILPMDSKSFFAKGIDARIVFDHDKQGLVTGLSIFQGNEKKAVKIE